MSEIDFSSPFERKSVVLHITEVSKHESDFSDLLLEAPGDPGEDPGPEDEGFEEAPADTEANTGGDDNTDTANEDNDDFTIDASDDGIDDTGTGDGDVGGEGDLGGDNASPETQDAEIDNAAKRKDREIFDSLSPQEQKIKTVKLKELFMDLYNRCDQIMDKYNSIGVDYEDLGLPIHKSVEALYGLKQMISTYLLYLFDSKSYIENDIQFNRFLTALNQIKLISKDMRDAHQEEIEKSNKQE